MTGEWHGQSAPTPKPFPTSDISTCSSLTHTFGQWSYFSSKPLNLGLISNLRPLAWMSLNLKWFKFKSLFKLDQSQSLVNELVSVVQLKSLASNLISLHCVYNSDQPFLVNYSGLTPLPILPTSQISTLPQIELLSLVLISWFCSIFLIFSNLGILNQLILF